MPIHTSFTALQFFLGSCPFPYFFLRIHVCTMARFGLYLHSFKQFVLYVHLLPLLYTFFHCCTYFWVRVFLYFKIACALIQHIAYIQCPSISCYSIWIEKPHNESIFAGQHFLGWNFLMFGWEVKQAWLHQSQIENNPNWPKEVIAIFEATWWQGGMESYTNCRSNDKGPPTESALFTTQEHGHFHTSHWLAIWLGLQMEQSHTHSYHLLEQENGHIPALRLSSLKSLGFKATYIGWML